MLRYLRILTWFLLTFGIVGLFAAAFGIDIGIGIGPPVVALMTVQSAISALILLGFKKLKDGKLHPQVLAAGAITLIVCYVVAGQIWIGTTKPERGANAVNQAQDR